MYNSDLGPLTIANTVPPIRSLDQSHSSFQAWMSQLVQTVEHDALKFNRNEYSCWCNGDVRPYRCSAFARNQFRPESRRRSFMMHDPFLHCRIIFLRSPKFSRCRYARDPEGDQAQISHYKPALMNYNQWPTDMLSQQAKKKHQMCKQE